MSVGRFFVGKIGEFEVITLSQSNERKEVIIQISSPFLLSLQTIVPFEYQARSSSAGTSL